MGGARSERIRLRSMPLEITSSCKQCGTHLAAIISTASKQEFRCPPPSDNHLLLILAVHPAHGVGDFADGTAGLDRSAMTCTCLFAPPQICQQRANLGHHPTAIYIFNFFSSFARQTPRASNSGAGSSVDGRPGVVCSRIMFSRNAFLRMRASFSSLNPTIAEMKDDR